MSPGLLAILLASLTLHAPCLDDACPDTDPLSPLHEELPPTLDELTDPLPLQQPPPLALPETLPTHDLLTTHLPTSTTLAPTQITPPAPTPPPTPPRLPGPPDATSKTLTQSPLEPPRLDATPLDAPPHEPPQPASRLHGTPLHDASPHDALAAALIALAAIGLYHRLTKRTLLEHATRQRLLALLDEHGPLTTTDLARRLEVSYRTARHHATKLEAFDLVCCIRERNPQRWALPRQAPHTKAPLSEARREVLALVERSEGVHLSEIARRLGIAKATAKHRLDHLLEQGWIQDETVGPLRRFFLTEDGRTRLEA